MSDLERDCGFLCEELEWIAGPLERHLSVGTAKRPPERFCQCLYSAFLKVPVWLDPHQWICTPTGVVSSATFLCLTLGFLHECLSVGVCSDFQPSELRILAMESFWGSLLILQVFWLFEVGGSSWLEWQICDSDLCFSVASLEDDRLLFVLLKVLTFFFNPLVL